MKAKLNLFQASILDWRELHPYSAVHVVEVREPFDAARLARAISTELQSRGLTGLDLDRKRRTYQWLGGAQDAELRVLAGGTDAWAVVREEIERQLNIAFAADGRFDPFRFFVVDGASRFHLGVAYDHFIGGGDSMVRLLAGIVGYYRDARTVRIGAHSPRYTESYARLFARQIVPILLGLGHLARLVRVSRRSFRPHLAAAEDGFNAFASFRLGGRQRAALARAQTEWGVTQNDLFVAMLLKALSPLAIARRREPRRKDLAVASIVNIRRDFGRGAEDAFGPLLASFHVSHPVPDEMSLRELVGIVHSQSVRIKRRKLYLQTLLAMSIASLEWRFMSLHRRQRFFVKHYPVWAGTTPLNAAPLWTAVDASAPPPEYLRGVSTGPLTPMVVALTTSDDALHVGISFRTSAFERSVVDGVAASMLACIESF